MLTLDLSSNCRVLDGRIRVQPLKELRILQWHSQVCVEKARGDFIIDLNEVRARVSFQYIFNKMFRNRFKWYLMFLHLRYSLSLDAK